MLAKFKDSFGIHFGIIQGKRIFLISNEIKTFINYDIKNIEILKIYPPNQLQKNIQY